MEVANAVRITEALAGRGPCVNVPIWVIGRRLATVSTRIHPDRRATLAWLCAFSGIALDTHGVSLRSFRVRVMRGYSAMRATDSSLPFSSLSPFLMVTYRTFFFASSARLFGCVGTAYVATCL